MASAPLVPKSEYQPDIGKGEMKALSIFDTSMIVTSTFTRVIAYTMHFDASVNHGIRAISSDVIIQNAEGCREVMLSSSQS